MLARRRFMLGALAAPSLIRPAAASLTNNNLIGFAAGGTDRTLSSSAQWNSGDAGYAFYTFSGDDLAATNSKWIRTLHSFTGNFDFQFTYASAAIGTEMFFFPTTLDGSFTTESGSADAALGASSGMFSFKCTSAGILSMQHAQSEEATNALANGDIIKIERTGTAVKVYLNAALIRTMTATSSVTVRLGCGSFGNSVDFDDISWIGGA